MTDGTSNSGSQQQDPDGGLPKQREPEEREISAGQASPQPLNPVIPQPSPAGDQPSSTPSDPAAGPVWSGGAYPPARPTDQPGAGFGGSTTTTTVLPAIGPTIPQPQVAGRQRPRWVGVLGLMLAAALVGGAAGGVVAYQVAPRSESSGVLSQPLPRVDDVSQPETQLEAVAARVLPSVVQLRVVGRGSAGEGSGMVLSADGLLLTNNHVIEAAAGGGRITVLFQDGRSAPARIVGRDPTSDLAVLRAEGVSGLRPVELGNSDAVRVGQQVIAFGSPLGLGGTVTTGIISARDRAVSVGGESRFSEATVISALQTDAAINPGNSGGPLTDLNGRVIGINSAIATTGAQGGSIGLGFAIPVNHAKRIAEELERTGRATRAVLGVTLAMNSRETSGAVIGGVAPGGPADQAGLRPGQVVTRVNDRPITNGNELVAAIRELAPGDRVTLIVDGDPVEVTLAGQTG